MSTMTLTPAAPGPAAAGRRDVTPAPWDEGMAEAVDRLRRHLASRPQRETARIYRFPDGAEQVSAADPISTPDRPPPAAGVRLLTACMWTMIVVAILRPLLLS